MKKMRLATGGSKAKLRATTLATQPTGRTNETSVLLPAGTAVDNGDDRAAMSIELTELNDGRLTEDRTSLKSLCSVHGQEDIVRENVTQITDTAVERVVNNQLQSGGTDPAALVTAIGTNASADPVDCRSCFARRLTAEDSSGDESAEVVGNRRRFISTRKRRGVVDNDNDNDIPTNLISKAEATSIRTGVSKTPQVAAVIAMAGRRGRRRLGELFVRMSSTLNAERVARVASAARRLEQREIQATIRMAIIITFFCCMWLGFFTVYVINSWCPSSVCSVPRSLAVCSVPRALDAFFFWLGYANSGINPILYTIFNDDFRRAFRKLLGCGGADASGRGGRDGREMTMTRRTGRL